MSLENLPLPVYPFRKGINQHAEILRKEINTWIGEEYEFMPHDAREKYKRHELGLLAARCVPYTDAPVEHIRPFNRWQIWGTVFDDYYDYYTAEAFRPIAQRMVDILAGDQVRPEDNGIFRQMAVTRDEFLAYLPAAWMEGLVETMYQFVRYGVEEEKPFKLAQRCPPLALFFVIREHSVAQIANSYMANGVHRNVLPRHIYQHAVVQRMISLNARLIAWQNDFYSFRKEQRRGKVEAMNLIWAVQQEYKISLEEAYMEAMRIHDADLKAFVQLLHSIPDFGEHQQIVVNFFNVAAEILSNMSDWYETDTQRYKAGFYVNPEHMGETRPSQLSEQV